jgi:hypothetical protein
MQVNPKKPPTVPTWVLIVVWAAVIGFVLWLGLR